MSEQVSAAELDYHDSEVRKHIHEVGINLLKLMAELGTRASHHDDSKLQSPEREIYAAKTRRLGQVEYGSPEYHQNMADIKPAIDHHFARNRHHPEHWPNGIEDMDLVDLMEMIADWTAATKRNRNGNVHKSIDLNTTRYKLSPQLARILTNTVQRYF